MIFCSHQNWPQGWESNEYNIMSDLKLGQIITTPQNRDAIHVAVAPVVAGEQLMPATRVFLDDEIHHAFEASKSSITAVGIVDPFLRRPVELGQTFWLFLFPNTVTGLRHEWTHPAFDDLAPFGESKAWLEDIASQCGVSYERMMDAVRCDDYINMGKNETYKEVLDPVLGKFHEHCAVIIGRETTAYPFSCSC